MRLLVLVNHFAPDRGGGGATYSDMCYALVQRGVAVTAVCPYPHYPEWKDKSGRNGLGLWRYTDQGVDVVRYGLFIPRNPRSLRQRILFELVMLGSVLRLIPAARRADAVMAFCPDFSAPLAATLMRALFHKPLWLNVQDVTSDAAAATGMTRSRRLSSILSGVERLVFNRADVWSSISPVMIRKLAPLRKRGQPLLHVPNWADADFVGHVTELPRSARGGRPPRLLYAGNIGGKQNLLEFCRFLHASNAPFEFRIFGSGGAAAETRDWLTSINDRRFSFGDFLGVEHLAEELVRSDFYVITELAGSGDSFFPSKLVNGLAAAVPILAVCEATSPLGAEMEAAKPGPRFGWDELERIPPMLSAAERDPTMLEHWAANARARARIYDREVIIDRIEHNLRRLARGEQAETDGAFGDVPANELASR